MEFIIDSKKYGKHTVLVDDEDWEKVNKFTWCLSGENRRGRSPYVQTRESNKKPLYLHRLLMPRARMVDHINGNTCDNRKSNLRASTKSQNGCNRGTPVNNKSGYKGVFILRRKYKNSTYVSIQASVGVNNKKIHIGTYETVEQAALAYNKAAIKYFGEFAKLNVIPGGAL